MSQRKVRLENQTISRERVIKVLEGIFKIAFLVYTMLSFCNITYGGRLVSFVWWPTALLGMGLILVRVIRYKNYITMPKIILLILFLVSFGMSTIFNIKYDIKSNIITGLYLSFYFLLLYTHEEQDNVEMVKKEFEFTSIIYLTYMFVLVVVGIVFMFTKHASVEQINGYQLVTGFVWGRLWGAFIDPNIGAVMACIAIFMCIYFFQKKKHIFIKIACSICIAFQVFYIAYTDSRTGRLCLAGGIGIYIFLHYMKKTFFSQKLIRKIPLFIIAVIVMMVIPKVVPIIPIEVSKVVKNIENNENPEDNIDIEVERGYDLEGDPSNRRFSIWKSGLEIFMEKPILGTSYYGIKPYALEHMPDTYIVNNDWKQVRNLHNEFMNILVSQGSIGAIIVIIMACSFLGAVIFGYPKKGQKENGMEDIFICCIIMMGIACMLNSAGMFFYNSPSSNMFWMMLGWLMIIVKKKDKKQR